MNDCMEAAAEPKAAEWEATTGATVPEVDTNMEDEAHAEGGRLNPPERKTWQRFELA